MFFFFPVFLSVGLTMWIFHGHSSIGGNGGLTSEFALFFCVYKMVLNPVLNYSVCTHMHPTTKKNPDVKLS